ncbi:RNA 2',3'-cyclic phosphodiesterase [Sphingomonas flavalba]|uniref:RNA 2',3'-cyclic phosphodiesterase n=1 Tax=Sphingomonas flavalba TaxID=2559804 RepID=UPI0039E18804
MHRLFVAIRPPAAIRAHLLEMMGGVAGARWQDDSQIHITLRFIGEVDGRMAEDIAAALGGLRHPPLALTLAGVGRFERKGQTEAVWAGIAPHERIAHLQAKVERALVHIGLPPERRAYLPHITLARFGRTGGMADRFLAGHAGLSGPAFTVDAFYLYQSHLGHGGSRYEAIQRYPLA